MEEVNRIQAKPSWKGNQSNNTKQVECNRCGYKGDFARDAKCPAKGKSCNKCGGQYHFAKKCRSRKRIHQVEQKNNSEELTTKKATKHEERHNDPIAETENTIKHVVAEEYIFNIITADNCSETLCKIGGVCVSAIIDSGSKYNLLNQAVWEKLKSKGAAVMNQRKETGKVFKAY